jgi:hypothetical protein
MVGVRVDGPGMEPSKVKRLEREERMGARREEKLSIYRDGHATYGTLQVSLQMEKQEAERDGRDGITQI